MRVKNFRLLRDVEIKMTQGHPLVLVGPNASGKSTIVEVFDFLARCGQDGLEAAIAAHGGVGSLRSAGVTGAIEIETDWDFSITKGEVSRKWLLSWHLSLSASPNGTFRVSQESLFDKTREIISTVEGKRMVRPENDPKDKLSEVKESNQLAFQALVDAERFPALGALKRIFVQIGILGALPTAPSWARDEQVSGSPRDSMVIGPRWRLSRQGLGLANVLYNIFTNHADTWQLLEKSFRGEFPFVKRLIFPPETGGSKISFAFEDSRFAGSKFYASEMSDGMVAYLCLLAAILNPEQRAILALDEPDSHLHPSALRRFMALAHRPLSRTLIVVTHSNALLDELKDPAESIRIVEATKNGTTLRKLDPVALESWRQEYSLSEMRRTGLIDHTNSDHGSEG